jgi:hypothetical protein
MKKKNWLPFHEAQAFVHTLGMTSEQQWYDYSRSGQRPSDIPARPDEIFQAEWLGWSNWLGEQNQLEKRRLRSHWRPFEQARASVHALGLMTVQQWYDPRVAQRDCRKGVVKSTEMCLSNTTVVNVIQ